MPRITVTVDERHEQTLSEVNPENQAEAVRTCIEEYERAQQLEAELKQRDAKVQELENQLMQANSRIDASNELVREVRSERTLAERKAEAGVGARLKWWMFGMGEEDR